MLPEVFETVHVAFAAETPLNFLNRLVERELHGIRPSLRSGVNTGGRRWFSKEDVYGIALIHWLFEAGLRAGSGKTRRSVIQDVLDEVASKLNSTANEAAKVLHESTASHLVVIRQIYPNEGKAAAKLQVRLMESPAFDHDDPLNLDFYGVEVWIPVGNLFERLDRRISYLMSDGHLSGGQNLERLGETEE